MGRVGVGRVAVRPVAVIAHESSEGKALRGKALRGKLGGLGGLLAALPYCFYCIVHSASFIIIDGWILHLCP